MGGRIYRQGQGDWDMFVKAGIVENEVFFTDDPIVTAHAIGKTKDTIGYCWPIDAAVAYTLASAGPDARLTSKEMVNQYTRMAVAMMSGTVGYGNVTDPRIEKCNHDMIDGYNVTMNDVVLNSDGLLKISKSSEVSNGIKSKMTPEMKDLMSFRVSTQWYKTNITSYGNTHDSKRRYISLLMTDRMKPVKEFIETTFGTGTWEWNSSHNVFKASSTKGECLWKADSEKHCGHHDPQYFNGWAMIRTVGNDGKVIEFGQKNENGRPIPAFKKIWQRGKHVRAVYSGWNHNMFEQNGLEDVAADRVVLWDRVSRGLGNTIPERDVIVQINAACRRMTARNFNVVVKNGLRNSATYHWKEWSWLHHLEAWIAQTSKKNRKEHDLVNGWKWTKYQSRKSYGYEIAKFKWIPGKENKDYDSNTDKTIQWVDGKAITTYTTPPAVKDTMTIYKIKVDTGYYGSKELPWYWRTKDEAKSFISFNTMLAGRTGAVNRERRTWDGSTGKELLQAFDGFTVVKDDLTSRIEMDMGADPEELMTARECFKALMWGSPQEFDEAYKLLSESSQGYWSRPRVENVVEDGGQEVVAA
tara:strand:+ start:7386 stop:9134 length:1749 start_codon:yes stop_codon:yes gene_type:complete